MKIYLASQSVYKIGIMQKFFAEVVSVPHYADETINTLNDPEFESRRLAKDKVLSIIGSIDCSPKDILIGGDQVGYFDGGFLEKPGTIENQKKQLAQLSNKEVSFYTSMYVSSKDQSINKLITDCTLVKFKELPDELINKYVEKENASDCAGGFKIESLGPLLMEYVSMRDPYALQGLPIMQLIRALEEIGISPI